MLGSILGDIAGSLYETQPATEFDTPLFTRHSSPTDDTVLTVATADCLLHGGGYADYYRRYYRHYPDAGYGGRFMRWAEADDAPAYHSFGNGSAMRVAPVGWAFDELERVVEEAGRSARVTHNHPEGIKGAEAVAAAVYLARTERDKALIRSYLGWRFGYDLERGVDEIKPFYEFDVSCQGSVPESIIAFLDSSGFEDALRKAIWLGGDADTMACIAGGIAEAYYGVPERLAAHAAHYLDAPLLEVLAAFRQRFQGLAHIHGQQGVGSRHEEGEKGER